MTGNAHGSGLRNGLQPRGNVHAVAEEVSSAYHYVAYVDTDAKANAALRREV
jgi:hypothetical protein